MLIAFGLIGVLFVVSCLSWASETHSEAKERLAPPRLRAVPNR